MAKGTPKKDKTPDKVPKTKKTVNSIVRDHPLENLVHSRRKRVPTAALLEYLKQKPKAPVAKKGGAGGKKKGASGTPKKSADKKTSETKSPKSSGRTRTMADVIDEGKKLLKGKKPKGKTRSGSKGKGKKK